MNKLELAFTLGFMISREGYNADCTYDHCGPWIEGISPPFGEDIAGFINRMRGENEKLFQDLMKQAMELINTEGEKYLAE